MIPDAPRRTCGTHWIFSSASGTGTHSKVAATRAGALDTTSASECVGVRPTHPGPSVRPGNPGPRRAGARRSGRRTSRITTSREWVQIQEQRSAPTIHAEGGTP
jgi:hypothetical protein